MKLEKNENTTKNKIKTVKIKENHEEGKTQTKRANSEIKGGGKIVIPTYVIH